MRIDAITEHVREGKHFGLALKDCGYDFPSQEAANFLSLCRVMETMKSSLTTDSAGLNKPGRVAKRAVVIRGLMFPAMILMLLLLVLVVMDINALNSSSGSF